MQGIQANEIGLRLYGRALGLMRKPKRMLSSADIQIRQLLKEYYVASETREAAKNILGEGVGLSTFLGNRLDEGWGAVSSPPPLME